MAGVMAGVMVVVVGAACGVKNICAAKHAAFVRNSIVQPTEKASILQLIDRSTRAWDKILSSFWFCPTHRSTFNGPHASCRLSLVLSQSTLLMHSILRHSEHDNLLSTLCIRVYIFGQHLGLALLFSSLFVFHE